MIRLYEYSPRIDDAGNATEAFRDFQNYLFSHPYDFLWDFPADKVVIYGIAYRISSLRRIPDGNQVTCLCICGGESSGNGGTTVISKIKTDVSLQGEGIEDNPLGVQLSQKLGNRLQILDDGCFVGGEPVPYQPPEIVLSSSFEQDEYLIGNTLANMILTVTVTDGSEHIRDLRIMEGTKTLHVFEIVEGSTVYTFELPTEIDSDTTFTASVSDGVEYLSNTLTYNFAFPAYCGVSDNKEVAEDEILAETATKITGNSFEHAYDTVSEQKYLWMCCHESRTVVSIISEKGLDTIAGFKKSAIKLTYANRQFNYSLYVLETKSTAYNFVLTFNFQ